MDLQSTSYVASTERTKFKETDFIDIQRIGAGSYAIVYKGLYGTFGHVAIKMLNQYEEVPIDCREIDLLLKLSHPHIVTFYGLLVSDYTLSTCRGYVMEYMSTGCLSRVIHNASLSYDGRQVVSWTMQICLGLAHLHSKGIIHRDIKPQNLLLGKTLDDLKISDFGTARNNAADMSLTEFVGTLGYMAPEVLQAADRKLKYSVSADVYSLAITLWEISRRERPYSHLKIANFMIANMILQGERPTLGPSPISTDFDGLIQRAWNCEASKRPTVPEFLEYIRSSERGQHDDTQQTSVPEVPLLIGDGGYSSFFILDVEANTWKRLSLSFPYNSRDRGSAFLNGEIYIFGGSDYEELRSTYKLTKEMKWTQLPDMIEGRQGISSSTVVFEGSIWVMGGSDWFTVFHKTVEAYDLKSDSWIRKPDMNTARSWAAAAVVKEKIFVCGGLGVNGSLNSVEYFDPQLSKWIFCTPIPAPRHGLAAVGIDGLLTVMGGIYRIHTREATADVWRMNVDDSPPTWSVLPLMKTKRSRLTASIVDGRIMVAGGRLYSALNYSSSSVEFFDGQAWTEGPAIESRLFDTTSTLVPQHFARSLLTTFPPDVDA